METWDASDIAKASSMLGYMHPERVARYMGMSRETVDQIAARSRSTKIGRPSREELAYRTASMLRHMSRPTSALQVTA